MAAYNQVDEEELKEEKEPFKIAPRFAAEGGRIGAQEGGIMDLESGRQMYFLGKLVKKAKRAVKKIVKSPVGKLGLLASPFLASSAARKGIMDFLFKKGTLASDRDWEIHLSS